ncbi:hypothetical protein ACN6LC_005945 [Streptomyces violaceoruber]|uniref:Small membrane protein n=1 Tax=Streptomyces coelicolor (strain ATCC BAA-471 / A3(2) / M145) TaxID=100226 RepID=Q9XAL1_STRCO|nr:MULTISPECIES: small membrane protein [Streptomyces]MDX2924637.1 hypothetical protein [Streptomyces sp. NRRL_B-16638]MDX3318946.1 hypothetical protein [Streptomyces sp. ME03-5684b]MDX3408667.1 hypothetical protein [Streptomyces sp. ME02-6977A]MYU43114.1 hypothetical protein [Streptomyces sp. SID7813]QFI43616.1 hypothetical protein FQ762_18495 [Streptomyces coelicolor A3(2)]
MTAVSEPVLAPVRPTVVRLLALALALVALAALVVRSDAYAQ